MLGCRDLLGGVRGSEKGEARQPMSRRGAEEFLLQARRRGVERGQQAPLRVAQLCPQSPSSLAEPATRRSALLNLRSLLSLLELSADPRRNPVKLLQTKTLRLDDALRVLWPAYCGSRAAVDARRSTAAAFMAAARQPAVACLRRREWSRLSPCWPCRSLSPLRRRHGLHQRLHAVNKQAFPSSCGRSCSQQAACNPRAGIDLTLSFLACGNTKDQERN
jgi:hypothetical protein